MRSSTISCARTNSDIGSTVSTTGTNSPLANKGSALSRKAGMVWVINAGLVEILIDKSWMFKIPMRRLKVMSRPPVLPNITTRPSIPIESMSSSAVASPMVIRPMSIPCPSVNAATCCDTESRV